LRDNLYISYISLCFGVYTTGRGKWPNFWFLYWHCRFWQKHFPQTDWRGGQIPVTTRPLSTSRSLFLMIPTSLRRRAILFLEICIVRSANVRSSGIPFTLLDTSIQPWVKLNQPSNIAAAAEIDAATTCTPLTATNPSTWWYESITHNGLSSFMSSDYRNEYSVFRNVVTDFGADNTGATDASTAIQNAINGMFLTQPQSLPFQLTMPSRPLKWWSCQRLRKLRHNRSTCRGLPPCWNILDVQEYPASCRYRACR
jgi:hypothetical protein